MKCFYFGHGTRAPRIDRQRVMTRTAVSISRHDQPDILVAKSAFPYISHAPGRQAIQPATPISTKRTRTRFCGDNYPPEPATSRKAIGTASTPAFGPETFPPPLALSSLKLSARNLACGPFQRPKALPEPGKTRPAAIGKAISQYMEPSE
jgi:hypothetical protein